MMDEDLVRACYEVLLGRAPETNEVVQQHLRRSAQPSDLLRSVVSSEEFQNRWVRPELIFQEEAWGRVIQTSASPLQLQAMLNRIVAQWTDLGESEPHWSVLTDDRYKAKHFRHNEELFWQSGLDSLTHLESLLHKHDIKPHMGSVLELGCGVGRITRHLAGKFTRVTAIDTSPGNIALAEAAVEGTTGIVDFILLQSLEDLEDLSGFDAFFSLITLQHNPPPLQLELLHRMLHAVGPGAFAYFQVPVGRPGYSFTVEEYLAETESRLMDMHCLPLNEVLKSINDAGMTVSNIQLGGWTNGYLSAEILSLRSK